MAVHSIIFTGENKEDYLLEPKLKEYLKKGRTYEEYQQAMMLSQSEKYKKYGRDIFSYFFYEKQEGLKNDIANKCLINKRINFSTDKINVIFGPNASGKSTILKAIAGHALCGDYRNFDGFTNLLHEPSELSHNIWNEIITPNDIKNFIYKKVKNTCNVEWDGNPVYYHNFINRSNTGSIDDFTGSILGSLGNVVQYITNKNSMNSGKQAIYMMEQIYNIVNSNISTESLINDVKSQIDKVNSKFAAAYTVQMEYILSKYNANNIKQNTILLDEVDNHFDIPATIITFKECLPEIQKVNNTQLIVVSHSPFVLSENVCNPDTYNIISMDKTYTENVRKLLTNIKF